MAPDITGNRKQDVPLSPLFSIAQFVRFQEFVISAAIATETFRYVQEQNDDFLALFPHRYDYIWADYPDPHGKPEWKTESRHPLSDRLIHQGSFLYGVRFGAETNYCLLDIDTDSIYHPRRDPFAISRILAALESLDLVAYIGCTSSYTGGIHLYFPFEQKQKCWQLALAIQTVLEKAGFKLHLGQLEIFPNPKPYVIEGKPNLYAAHRLPMQVGSYLLNQAWEPVHSHPETFVQRWQTVQTRNTITTKTIEQVLKANRRKQYCLSQKADKFLNDLNADIEPGWSGSGQTNYLLGRIAMRSYIFGHLLHTSQPLEGKTLVNNIVATAKALPGYQQWCRHQHEIEKRAEEWARCIENSHYFHYGITKENTTASEKQPEPTWNQKRSEATREKIRAAIADLLNKACLPSNATARFHTLINYGIGGGSLYRHRDLWHPNYLIEPVENPPDPPTPKEVLPSCCQIWQQEGKKPKSLLHPIDGNPRTDNLFNHDSSSNWEAVDSNTFPITPSPDPVSTKLPLIQPSLFDLKTFQAAKQEAFRIAREQAIKTRREASQAAQTARMQQFLASGDPILVAEALTWAEMHKT